MILRCIFDDIIYNIDWRKICGWMKRIGEAVRRITNDRLSIFTPRAARQMHTESISNINIINNNIIWSLCKRETSFYLIQRVPYIHIQCIFFSCSTYEWLLCMLTARQIYIHTHARVHITSHTFSPCTGGIYVFYE